MKTVFNAYSFNYAYFSKNSQNLSSLKKEDNCGLPKKLLGTEYLNTQYPEQGHDHY